MNLMKSFSFTFDYLMYQKFERVGFNGRVLFFVLVVLICVGFKFILQLNLELSQMDYSTRHKIANYSLSKKHTK